VPRFLVSAMAQPANHNDLTEVSLLAICGEKHL